MDCRDCFNLRARIPVGPETGAIQFSRATATCRAGMLTKGTLNVQDFVFRNPFHAKQRYESAEDCASYDDEDMH